MIRRAARARCAPYNGRAVVAQATRLREAPRIDRPRTAIRSRVGNKLPTLRAILPASNGGGPHAIQATTLRSHVGTGCDSSHRVRAELSVAADPPAVPDRARRRARRDRALDCAATVGKPEGLGGRRQPSRRQRRDRDGSDGQRRARRLHARHHERDRADLPGAQQDAVRHVARFRAGHSGVGRTLRAGSASVAAGQYGGRIHRLRQGQSRQARLRLLRHLLAAAALHGIICVDDRHHSSCTCRTRASARRFPT